MTIKQLLTSAAVLSFSISTFASVVGTDITTHRAYPSVNDNYSVSPVTTTVVAGNSDSFAFQSSYVDIDANQITIDFTGSSGFVGDAPTFDGYVFRGFNGSVTNAQLMSSDIANTTVTFDDSNIYVNFSGSFSGSSNVIISFDAASATPPPPPIANGVWCTLNEVTSVDTSGNVNQFCFVSGKMDISGVSTHISDMSICANTDVDANNRNLSLATSAFLNNKKLAFYFKEYNACSEVLPRWESKAARIKIQN